MEETKQRVYEISLDPSTGLYDRRTMWSRLAEEVSRARRYNYPLSLMLIRLKTDNGQSVDHLVQQLAKLLKRDTRSVDFLARYSEDAFALLLPCTDEAGALRLAERIHRLMETTQPAHGQQGRPSPVRIGLTSAPGDYRGDKIALVEQVERALRRTARGKGPIIVVPASRETEANSSPSGSPP